MERLLHAAVQSGPAMISGAESRVGTTSGELQSCRRSIPHARGRARGLHWLRLRYFWRSSSFSSRAR